MSKIRSLLAFSLLSCAAFAQAAELQLSASDEGLTINTGNAGQYVLPMPGLSLGEKDYSGEKPTVALDGAAVVAKYPSGAELRMEVDAQDKSVTYLFKDIPATAHAFIFQMAIPIGFINGGAFAFGKDALRPFPAAKEKQIVGAETADGLVLVDPMNSGFRIQVPTGYAQVQDNRVFDWPLFMYIHYYLFKDHLGESQFKIHLEPYARNEAGGTTFLVDRYGQNARKDFASKVRSDDELKADGPAQKATLAAFSGGPALDSYGGLAGSGAKYQLAKTGFFHVGKAGGRQVLVTPEGNAFFQLAVCGIALSDDFTLVAGREKTYEWLPPKDGPLASAWRAETPGVVSFCAANWVRKFGRAFDLEEWSGQVVDRLRHWGFNSAGAFSQNTETMRKLSFPYVSFLPGSKEVTMLPDKVGASEVIDPFAPNAAEALDKAFAARLPAAANDPLLIGYFLGNEQHFELLPKIIPAYQASKVPAKGRLVAWLREKYSSVEKFNAAWNPAKAIPNWDAAGEEPLFVRTEQGAADMQEFYRLYLETYYTLVSTTFHKYDKNHLLIGNRFTPGTANNKTAVEIAGKYMDVVSVNYYTYAMEGDFLKQVHDWSGGRPIILSEWYYSVTDQGLGGGKEVKDQTERAKAYRNYVEQAAALPFVVGSQWFIYNDQSITGRFFEGFHGEGNNTGFVNVADRPYPELTAAARETSNRVYDVMFGQKEPFAFKDPRFDANASGPSNKVVAVPKALPDLALDGTTRHWPPRPAEPIESTRLVLGNPNPKLRGDFRLCWDETNLYFLIQVKDATPERNDHEPKAFWSGDNVELFIGSQQPGQKGSMIFSDRQILLGTGKKTEVYIPDHADEAAQCRLLVTQDVSRDGYVASIAIPWSVLGVKPTSGLELLFDVGIDNSDDGIARNQQLMWNGTAENTGSRENWGRARLVEN